MARKVAKKVAKRSSKKKDVVLLSGENPQIAKGDGDGPVQAYIDAIPGWKQEVAREIDRLVVRAWPKVVKAVKWNSPLYGVERGVWFLGVHCFTKYVKVAFFRGARMKPVPPGASKQVDVRYLDVREGDVIDEKVFVEWVRHGGEVAGREDVRASGARVPLGGSSVRGLRASLRWRRGSIMGARRSG